MLGSNNPQNPDDMTNAQKHEAITKQLDEIKRYSAGVYQKVDTEIDEIRNVLNRVDKQVRENDQQIDRIEQFERTIRNIEQTVRNIERKIK